MRCSSACILVGNSATICKISVWTSAMVARWCNVDDIGSLYGANDALKWIFRFSRKGTGRMGSVQYQECPRGPMDKASAYEAGDCGFESRRRLSLLLLKPIFMHRFYTTSGFLVFLCVTCVIHFGSLRIESLANAPYNTFASFYLIFSTRLAMLSILSILYTPPCPTSDYISFTVFARGVHNPLYI